jgi:L-alanine-DL-glutamate epimerase-like enolase superfamily enzyme
MPETIVASELWRLELPLGRTVGDRSCAYDETGVLAVCLTTSAGHVGWGYGSSVWKGRFSCDAHYVQPMALLGEVRACFAAQWWQSLQDETPAATAWLRRSLRSTHTYLDAAVRMALWDLIAQSAELPLWRLLGGRTAAGQVRAYGSLLDFPLEDAEAAARARDFVRRGFFAVKAKAGGSALERDMRRLKSIRSAIGLEIELAIDANEAWDVDTAIDRISAFQAEGLDIAYVEDPLPREQVEQTAHLAAAIGVDVVGNDYLVEPQQFRRLMEQRAVQRLRPGADLDLVLRNAELADDYGVPMSFGNSMFEFNVHAAAAMPNVDRLEFSDLARNQLMQAPVWFENGIAFAPEVAGHGLVPRREVLEEFSRP